MLPDGWTRACVGDLCSFSSGNGFTPADWSDSGLPIIRIQNLNGSQVFNFFAGEPAPEWIVEPGELLFAWAGVQGVSFGPCLWPGPRGVLNQHIYRVEPRSPYERRWVYAALQLATQHIERRAHGFKANLVHVRKSEILNEPVLCPPSGERRHICDVLDCNQRRNQRAEAKLAACKVRKRGLMQQLLTGKRRLPRFAEPWRPRTFSEFLTESKISGSGGHQAKKITVRLYGRGACEKRETKAGSSATQYFRRKTGQLIYSKLDFLNGAFAIVPPELDGFESTLDLPAFDIDPSIDSRWLLYYFTEPHFYKRHIGLAHGGRKARRVSPAAFLSICDLIPAINEQRSIADVLETCDREILALNRQLELLKDQKKGLLQKLLTGQIRVPALKGAGR